MKASLYKAKITGLSGFYSSEAARMEILGQFVRVEWQEGFSSVGCEKLAGRDEVFGMSNPGAERRAAGVGVA